MSRWLHVWFRLATEGTEDVRTFRKPFASKGD